MIGLTPAYVRKSLPVPFSCWIRLLLSGLVFSLVGLILHVAGAHPVKSGIAVVAALIVRKYRRRRARRALLKSLVNDMVEAAYDMLADCDDSEGFAALHLRDELTHLMHPSDPGRRKYLSEKVWPGVVLEIRRDNRIRKSTREVGGKRLEWWEWISRAGKMNRRNRGVLSPILTKKNN
uniref:Man1/Src1-like C-terminal domain-containing protein n=1 Tax=Pseudictyota dubia TaxID=2749911 RepID=A0A7R9VSV6_9STRA